ncbi:MAG: thioredoxin domain-containing protein [Desulfobacterales bacterium]
MKLKLVILLFSISIIAVFSTPCFAALEWSILSRLKIDASPVDVAVSLNEKWVFVLNDRGEVLVFSRDGGFKEKIQVGRHIDQIKVGPRDNILYLNSRKNKTVEIIEFDFIQNINTAYSPFKGPVNAPVAIAVFTDFECPHCAQLVPLLEQVLVLYPKDVKIVFKNFPLQTYTFSMKAATAALAAESQGKFWEFHDLLFKDFNQLNDQKIKEIANKLGLNEQKFEKKVSDPQISKKIRQDVVDGINAGVMSVPSVFINGKLLRNRSMEGFIKIIDVELSKARKKR